jgi:hypothetical protein
MELAANAGPMPAPFAIVGQTYYVQHNATKTVFSEHNCHRTPFALLTQRCRSLAHGVCLWFSSSARLGTKDAKCRWAWAAQSEPIFN